MNADTLMLWLKGRLDALETQHLAIIARLEDNYVSPELEQQVRRARQLSASIDQKVPDVSTPTNKGENTQWQ